MRSKLSEFHSKITQMASDGFNYADVANELGVNKSSVRRYAISNNINFIGLRFNSEVDTDVCAKVIQMYKDGFTGDQITAVCSLNRKTVYSILNKENLINKQRYNYKRGKINDNAFSDFENDRLAAYFYGWIVTDGCLSDEGNISLALQSCDGYIVNKLLEYVGSNRKASDRNIVRGDKVYTASRGSFCDKIIIKRLVDQGLSPRKSGKEVLPKFNWLNGKTSKDFWQGCLEGDGWVFVNEKQRQIGLLGSDELLLGFIKFCEDVCGVKKGKTPNRLYNTDKIKQVSYNNNDAMLIAKTVWNDTAFRLERKYALSQLLISSETKRQERFSTKYICEKNGKFLVSVLVKHKFSLGKSKPIFLKTVHSLSEAQELRDEFLDLYEQMLK